MKFSIKGCLYQWHSNHTGCARKQNSHSVWMPLASGTAEMGADTSGMITNPRERDQGLGFPKQLPSVSFAFLTFPSTTIC